MGVENPQTESDGFRLLTAGGAVFNRFLVLMSAMQDGGMIGDRWGVTDSETMTVGGSARVLNLKRLAERRHQGLATD